MAVRKHSVTVTTIADGSATAYTGYLWGFIEAIYYVKVDYADGVDFTITVEGTGESLWTQANVNAAAAVAPRMPTHSGAGVASLYAAGGTAIQSRIPIGARDRIKIVLAQGGNVKSGTFVFLVSDT